MARKKLPGGGAVSPPRPAGVREIARALGYGVAHVSYVRRGVRASARMLERMAAAGLAFRPAGQEQRNKDKAKETKGARK